MATSQPRWVVVDDTDTRIHYSPTGWFQDQGSQDTVGNFGPSYESTLHGTKSNASLSFSFSGSRVIVTGSNNPRNDSGVIDPSWQCFVDNISIGQTTPFPFGENNWVFCEQDNLVDGPHVITVNATVNKQQTFWFDQIQYVPSASVPLDNEAILVDNLDPALQFGDGWGPLGGTANVTSVPNSIFTFNFIGKSLSWYAFIPTELAHPPATGSYSVDGGAPVNFNLKGLPSDATTTIYNQKFFETPSYPAGPHKIVVTFLGNSSTTPLGLDYLIVQNGTFASTSTFTTSAASTSHTSGSGSDTSNGSSTHSNNTGPIVGGIVGGLVLIAVAVVAFIYFRRWEKRQNAESRYGDRGPDDNGMTVEPFLSGPTLPSHYNAGGGGYAPQQFSRSGNTTGHNQMPSQTTTDLNSIIPPSSSSHNLPPQTLVTTNPSHGHSPSLPSNEGYASVNSTGYTSRGPMSEKMRLEAEATASTLRTQRTPLSPPVSTTSGSSSSRVIHHEDSGVRLPPHRAEEEAVVEIPPMYTPG